MAVLRFPLGRLIVLLILLSILSSCAKLSYLIRQGLGQSKLILNSRHNDVVLNDPSVPDQHKEKIREIEGYKDYFYKYWKQEPTGIYSKTTILESEAVTYLVISSKYDEVKAREVCFPIMGCYPYIGFFKKEFALEYAKEQEKSDLVTWVRPVYAYSTLGYFEDRILSSFFKFSSNDLAELIFHELFHTIFFIKDDVDFSENLANYFAQEMVFEYFGLTDAQKKEKLASIHNDRVLNQQIVKLIGSLNGRYKSTPGLTKGPASEILESFLENDLYPSLKELCRSLVIEEKKCYPIHRKWNNASLATVLTYQKHSSKLKKLHKKLGLGLIDFFHHIKKQYQIFKDLPKSDKDFTQFLFFTL